MLRGRSNRQTIHSYKVQYFVIATYLLYITMLFLLFSISSFVKNKIVTGASHFPSDRRILQHFLCSPLVWLVHNKSKDHYSLAGTGDSNSALTVNSE